MRAIVVGPLADYSTHDVAVGWTDGLRDCGVDTLHFDLGQRLVWYLAAKVYGEDGDVSRQMDLDEARQAVTLNLLAEVYRHDPELVLIVHGAHVHPPYIAEIRCPVVWVATESPYEDEAQALTIAHAEVDAILLNDPTNQGVFEQIAPTFYVPHAYRPNLHRPDGPKQAHTDVCFVGTGYPERIATLEAVDWSGIDLRLAGQWDIADDSPLTPFVADWCIDNSETVEWYRSTEIGLNMYREIIFGEHSTADGWAIGPREVELAACEVFYLRRHRPESDELFPFLPAFTSAEELEWLIREWLPRTDDRKQLGRRAAEAVADRTFSNNARRLLSRMGH